MDTNSVKDFSCSKYDRHYYHKVVHREGLVMCHPIDLKNFNNPDNNTSATVKFPWYCPVGAKCHICRDNGKGMKKIKANNLKIMINDLI